MEALAFLLFVVGKWYLAVGIVVGVIRGSVAYGRFEHRGRDVQMREALAEGAVIGAAWLWVLTLFMWSHRPSFLHI